MASTPRHDNLPQPKLALAVEMVQLIAQPEHESFCLCLGICLCHPKNEYKTDMKKKKRVRDSARMCGKGGGGGGGGAETPTKNCLKTMG
jgi:hypothetical protein